ncbi:MAG: hypothetical protein ONB31_09620 [candidate division KSB1 bacterium]|nr:hypothetical protein [candidate division KSB1 bacterium]MDZ7334920.1 hypothetical protein [candidate division KSB1 bacterium]MDZ7357526.1 hypothetical protein [candidate division KSB1 bacterium]MDZ7399729.1 hypothetical protein [candidate division KSB1 bacterium]
MRRLASVVHLLLLAIISIPLLAQDQSEKKIELSRKNFGFQIGSGLFQKVTLSLTNFDQQVIASSPDLLPLDIKANFYYFFTPNLAIRFTSGYGFNQEITKDQIDYSKVHLNQKHYESETQFSVAGFPNEITLIFQTPIDVRANSFLHFGFGLGYYVYNYQAKGMIQELDAKTMVLLRQEKYRSPELTLSGAAQFFVFGFEIKVTSRMAAMLELSKLGWSEMKLTQDHLSQQVENGKIIFESQYGFWQKNYRTKNGFDDIAMSLGVLWQL